MKKRVAGAALTTAAVVASLTVGATAASASPYIHNVPCGRSDFLAITIHTSTASSWKECFADAGTFTLTVLPDTWVTRISTGNNRVQWWGDGRWQPATPIAKNTVYLWPNHPGGVSIYEIRIL